MKSEKRLSLNEYIDLLQSQGHYWFEKDQLISALGHKSTSAINSALQRLRKKNRVKAVRSNFYIILPLEYRAIGCLPATWFIEPLMRFLQADYYLGLLSAASYYGASHQQVMVTQIITNKKIRPINIEEVKIDFHYQKYIPQNFLELHKTQTGKIYVASPELIMYDLFKYINAAGQLHNVATVLCELVESVSIEQLICYITSYPVSPVYIQRLGYLLDHLQLEIDTKPLRKWLSGKKLEYQLLTTGNFKNITEKNKDWHILVNEQIETDL